jgi:hypothetical protein
MAREFGPALRASCAFVSQIFPKGVPYAGQPHHTKYVYGCPQ